MNKLRILALIFALLQATGAQAECLFQNWYTTTVYDMNSPFAFGTHKSADFTYALASDIARQAGWKKGLSLNTSSPNRGVKWFGFRASYILVSVPAACGTPYPNPEDAVSIGWYRNGNRNFVLAAVLGSRGFWNNRVWIDRGVRFSATTN